MAPHTPATWVPLLALLALLAPLAPRGAGPRACSLPDVLRLYRALILEDLQAALRQGAPGPRPLDQGNRTGAGAPRRPGPPGAACRAQKEHGILLSIASLARTLRGAVAGGPRGALERAAWTVAVRTEAVMRRHCRVLPQRQRQEPGTRTAGRPAGRRLLLRALDAAATCWGKLFALRAKASGRA